MPLIEDVIGGVECHFRSRAWRSHSFVAEVKSAVLNKDGSALNLVSTGWNYGG